MQDFPGSRIKVNSFLLCPQQQAMGPNGRLKNYMHSKLCSCIVYRHHSVSSWETSPTYLAVSVYSILTRPPFVAVYLGLSCNVPQI